MGRATYAFVAFDRALTRAALDVALEVAAAGGTKADLAERLAPVVGEKEASGRTRAHVARVWLAPPAHAAPLIGWAVEHRDLDPGRTVLHHVASLATTPELVPVTVLAAKQAAANGGRIDPARIATVAAKAVGSPREVANAMATLRELGLLMGTAEQPMAAWATAPKALAGWCTHALLVIRRSLQVDIEAWRDAPELGLLGKRPTGGVLGYPLLDFRGAGGRTVATERE